MCGKLKMWRGKHGMHAAGKVSRRDQQQAMLHVSALV